MGKLILLLVFLTALSAEARELRYSPEFILEKLLERKGLRVDPAIPLPVIKYTSRTSLAEFQADIGAQWPTRPETTGNAFVIDKNIIYLLDDEEYYTRTRRKMEDSLAHELAHFIQVRYQGWDIRVSDDSIELDAVDAQTWFRENFCNP